MSCTRLYKTEVVNLTVNNQEELQAVEENCNNLSKLIIEKMEKISKISETLEFNIVRGQIILSDPLGIINNLTNICESFGFNVTEANNGVVLNSEVLELLYLGSNVDLRKELSKILRYNPKLSMNYSSRRISVDEEQEKILERAKNKQYTLEEIRQIRYDEESTYARDSLIRENTDKISEEQSQIIRSVNRKIARLAEKHKKEIQSGMKSLLVERANSLGYEVQETQQNGTIKLTLVRR